jgi:hypothetical protein
MTTAERLWVVESLMEYRDESDGDFPTWAELVEVVEDIAGDVGQEDAERRVWEALRQKQIAAVFDDEVDITLKLGPEAFAGHPSWLRNHPWARREA